MQNATMAPDTMAVLKQAEESVMENSLKQTKELAESVGVRLTPNELTVLREKLARQAAHDTINEQMHSASQKALTKKVRRNSRKHLNVPVTNSFSTAIIFQATREICLSVICSNENTIDRVGVRVVDFFDYLGTALFAVVGAQVAGDAGMNLVGCSLVGCAAAMGGGSINALLYGGTTPLLGSSPGVRWVANPSFLVVAFIASFLTFFGWPYYCKTRANRYIDDADIDRSGTISRFEFLQACI